MNRFFFKDSAETIIAESYEKKLMTDLFMIPLNESYETTSFESVMAYLSEESESEVRSRVQELKYEIEQRREEVIKKRDFSKALTWWAVGLALAGIAGLIFGSEIIYVLGMVLSLILSLVNMGRQHGATEAISKLKGSRTKLEGMRSRAKDSKTQNEIDDLLGRIDEVTHNYSTVNN